MELLTQLWLESQHPHGWWQGVWIITAWLLAWVMTRRLRPHLNQQRTDMNFMVDGLGRVLFPLLALLWLALGKAVLKAHAPVAFFQIALPLMSSMVTVRLLVYLLQHVFLRNAWVIASERAIAGVIWLGFALHILGVLPDLLALLDDLSVNVGKQHISILTIIQALGSVLLTVLLAMWLGRMLEARIMHTQQLDSSLRVVFSKLVRVVLLVLGVMIALPLVGVDLTLLSVFGSALGVGLGFGLQKIASNYVSGFIVLLDRSVRLGDMITVDNRYGEVTKLTTRYVVLRALDGTESLIPNESFIANTVINHSYSNRQALLSMPFQVSYDTDLHALLAAMESVALTNARVMPQPPPRALVKEFADSGINLQLNVWLSDPESGLGNLRSELNLAIWDYFKANGIEIPFPQREVRVLPGASEWSATK